MSLMREKATKSYYSNFKNPFQWFNGITKKFKNILIVKNSNEKKKETLNKPCGKKYFQKLQE